MRTIPREAAAALFLRRQHLDKPFSKSLSAENLAAFVSDVGGVQLDSINVLDRAHYLTFWSRFGPYDKTELDRLIYEKRVLLEYWAHAACLVAASDLPGWARAMADYKRSHTGWSGWLKANARVLAQVQGEIRREGPLSSVAFARPKSYGKATGWWDWKPAHHALFYLWMSGRLAVHSRKHFQKHYDLASRVLPEIEPMPHKEFLRWHLRKAFHALGAAESADLSKYLTFPRFPPAERRKVLDKMLADGEVVEIKVEQCAGRWFALHGDLGDLDSVGPALGTTLLSPFDSLLWHRARAKTLFDFDYKIEVYTPAGKRVHGYYAMPILHNGRLIGRLDPKYHRAEGTIEVRGIHFEHRPDEEILRNVDAALGSLAKFLGAAAIRSKARWVRTRS